MGRLILVEGIPGSGKTTMSMKIADYLSLQKKTEFYKEGDGHPADLAWCACIPKEQFGDLINHYPEYEKSIREHMYEEEGFVIVPYTCFPIDDPLLYQKMESFEVYDNRVSLQTFMDLHLKKWKSFGEKAKAVDEYTVFECAFLQNHINELLLFHCCEEEEIKEHLLKLIDTVKALKPIMFYLAQPDVYETIRRVSDARVDEYGNKAWMERVIPYIENTPYGFRHNLKGFEGMAEYFSDRKRMELKLIHTLPIETYVINNLNYNWYKVWEEIKTILETIA